jgi:hypothetical protein
MLIQLVGSSERHMEELELQAAASPGLVRELNRWGEMSTEISRLLDELQNLRTSIAVCILLSAKVGRCLIPVL